MFVSINPTGGERSFKQSNHYFWALEAYVGIEL